MRPSYFAPLHSPDQDTHNPDIPQHILRQLQCADPQINIDLPPQVRSTAHLPQHTLTEFLNILPLSYFELQSKIYSPSPIYLRASSLFMARRPRARSSFRIAFEAYVLFLSTLGVFIQVKFQANSVSPFEDATISSFVVVISIYMGTVIVGKKFKFIRPIQLLFGALAPILLLLILVPIFGRMLLGFWVILTVKMAWDYLHQLCFHFLYKISRLALNLIAMLMTRNPIIVEGLQEPPV
ncbi:uncharacterized protein LOC117932412 isoform X2 [Vitis riparia]|uniref:uncharacterized protein LOC117932412 isoform X2 n=1 Tax=Vitis riparia TaxID=96939 RepID=UPI00155AD074|nr:uncharacterized protein LOC117932412 isoform X2 [Vitis riparia]